ncbi:glucose uptake family protein [Streptococcus pseudoporcinus]|uniref:Glucose uptake family protein n=1 Tax=Streptococcus pseudoporcinus TaxID=361101 RepID=A0A4V6L7L9_9STRE|nr:GRP family sugar transporter [Streptococcus pseudoporcinus]VTS43787.1 glucose uptake family protein [Streptococcus pseudoporcinus]
MEGILFALVPMVAWGSIGFVSNKIGGKPSQQTFGMTLGAVLFAIIVWIVKRPEMTSQLWIFGFLGGFLWSIGQTGQFHAMKYMGVSVANPLSSGSQLVLGSLIGVFLFGEWTQVYQYILGSCALVLLIIGFYFSSKKDKNSQKAELHHYGKGFKSLTYSTIGYVSYVVLFNNIMKFELISVLLPMAIGMVFGASLFMSFKLSFDTYVLKNSLVGIMWGIGNVFMLLAASKAGLAIAFSFSQLGAIISIIGGIIFLGEKKSKQEMRWVILGIICFIAGAILLGIVKA